MRKLRTSLYLSVFLPMLLSAGSPLAKPFPAPLDADVLQSFDELATYIAGIDDSLLNRGRRRSFLARLDAAEAAYSRGHVCTAEHVMNAYLHTAQALRRSGRVAIAERLYNRGRALRDSFFDVFVADPSLPRPKCFDPSDVAGPEVAVQTTTNRHFAATVSFGSARLWSVEAGDEIWSELELPGLPPQGGIPGLPAVPVWRALVAVPQGAEAGLRMLEAPALAETLYVNLYPYQSEAADQASPGSDPDDPDFTNPPFTKDVQSYEVDAFFPAVPCSVRPLGQYRDLRLVQVLCAAGQYNPVSDELRLFDNVRFDIEFEGGADTFITSQTLSPFESSSKDAIGSALNGSTAAAHIEDLDLSTLVCAGEELLILTHPDFRDAADDLAQWKEDKGIATTVVNVGEGTAYESADAIDDLIESRYDDCVVRLSYVLLLGDVEYVPPAGTDYDTTGDYCGSCGDATTGSDWGYALYPQGLFDVFFPDFGVGRIAVDTAEEAQRVVDKIVLYESDPPFIDLFSGAPFYTTAALAAQFQCCRMNEDGSPLGGQFGRTQRSFIEVAETARNAVQIAGKTGERIYTETVDGDYTGDSTPNRYYNGTLLPLDLRSGSGFAWDGSTGDIADAFNAGRFLVLHRDHGNSSGFSHPSFTTSHLGLLDNQELLPVVYSVNCASGYFDRETNTGGTSESFMEHLLMEPDGGMVGGLGDVRNSPTWANSALTRGFFDATWPNLAPEYGTATPKRRLADILNHGKVYMLTQVGVPQTAGSVSLEAVIAEYIMWHAYGDPTLELWTSNPYLLILELDYELEVLPEFLWVWYQEEGAVITALQRSEQGIRPVARGQVQGGVAQLAYVNPPVPNLPLILSASKENAVSVRLTTAPAPQPDLVIRDLMLPTPLLHRGDDLSVLLGVKVGNQGTATAPGMIDPAGNTQDGYMIDLVLSADTSMPAGFATVPQPAGIAYAEDGLLQGGRISRTPDVAPMTDLGLSNLPPVSSDIGGVIPEQAPEGRSHLCARIDPGNLVAEADETNNVFCVAVSIAPAR